jgi:hypothetical protein
LVFLLLLLHLSAFDIRQRYPIIVFRLGAFCGGGLLVSVGISTWEAGHKADLMAIAVLFSIRIMT